MLQISKLRQQCHGTAIVGAPVIALAERIEGQLKLVNEWSMPSNPSHDLQMAVAGASRCSDVSASKAKLV